MGQRAAKPQAGKDIGLVSPPPDGGLRAGRCYDLLRLAQLLRLLLGIAYEDRKDITTVLRGDSACVHTLIPSILKNECQVAVPYRGNRGRASALDDKMIFSVLKRQLRRLAYGIEQDDIGSY